MREDWSDTSIDAILTSLEDIWPQFKKEVIGPLEILTAKSVPDNAQADFGEIKPKIVKAVRSLRDLKEFGGRPLDSQRDINELKRLMNSLFRSMIPGIPRNQTPLSYIVGEVRRFSDIPADMQVPPGLNYQAKHLGLQNFIGSLVATRFTEDVL